MTLEYECFRILSMAPTMPSGDGLPSNGGADRDMLLARAKLLCDRRGWELSAGIGGGRTSSVFDVVTADGVRAVKIFRPHGFKGANGERRRRYLAVMVRRLIDCDFPYLTKIEEGEDFADTFYIKMRREQGRRLSDVLTLVPVDRIRDIVRQIAAAAHVLEPIREVAIQVE
jgi:hypothetical protein